MEITSNNSREKEWTTSNSKRKYDKLSTNKALAGVIRLKQTNYDQGENAGKVLIRQHTTK